MPKLFKSLYFQVLVAIAFGIVLAATLLTVDHIPVAAIALIFSIDRFMSEGRALTNIIGNTVATIVVAKWEKEIDMEKAKALIG